MIHSYSAMACIMIVSGLLSSMYVWSDKWDDVRLSANDAYMIGLMTGFMTLFMSALAADWFVASVSVAAVVVLLYLIRTQRGVSPRQYFRGMIPHHSMAVHMSRRLLASGAALTRDETAFVKNVLRTQEAEIAWMKKLRS
jgi:uncharacterized protein (DUF305 family)